MFALGAFIGAPDALPLRECGRGYEWHQVLHGIALCDHHVYVGTALVSDARCVREWHRMDAKSCR